MFTWRYITHVIWVVHRNTGQEDEEKDVGSYWMTLRKGGDTSEGGSTRSHYVESSLWKRLWTCRETDY
jgi:hypothetical protein